MSSEFDPWAPQEPPADFADRVLAADALRRRRDARRRWLLVAAPALAAAAAAAVLVLRRPPQGEISADVRREIALDRAVAVLEPGARIRWKGLEVEQTSGDVFYRVDKGAPYRVATPVGSVDVAGTCFRVRIHGTDRVDPRATDQDEGSMGNFKTIGAGVVAGALLTVGVYEGKVRVSSAGQQQTLEAGGSLTVGQRAAGRDHADPAAGTAAAGTPAPSDSEKAYEEANRSLVENVVQLNRKIADAEEKKKALEKQLVDAQAALAAAPGGGDAKPKKNEFDLSQDDWKKLAEDGTVKFRVPCFRKPDWQPSEDMVKTLGLAPGDAPMLKEIYKKSNERAWTTLRPLCAAAVGSEGVADKIGPDTCIHLILDIAHEKDRDSSSEAMRQVGEIRAGLRPAPAAGDNQHPVVKMFLALTDEMKSFEGDLAQQVGPEDAHRISFSDGLCARRSTFGGPGPRSKK